MPRVLLAIPNAGKIWPHSLVAILSASRDHQVNVVPQQFGDIPMNFNMLWCHALNNRDKEGIDYFAMLHTDLGASERWLDILIAELVEHKADVVSAIMAIKDSRGLTTTGTRFPGTWGTKRATLHEVFRLPETYSIKDTDEPDQILAIGTGCWVCDFRKPWVEKFPGFQNKHKIEWANGQAMPCFDSEDWLFSDWLATQGAKVMVTRKVATYHRGENDHTTTHPWGSWETELQPPSRKPSAMIRGILDPCITIETEKPVALESLDHTQPLGAANDNTWKKAFNRKLWQIQPEPRVLDLGCSGGGFVRSILEDGGFAIGIEGSDFSFRHKRAEWGVIPNHLFTADCTEPFRISNCQPDPVRFNVVTGWEFFEHIATDKIPAVLQNVKDHAQPGALFMGSISQQIEPHHQTVQSKQWWIEEFRGQGFVHRPDLERHFGDDIVRGFNYEHAPSFFVVFQLA